MGDPQGSLVLSKLAAFLALDAPAMLVMRSHLAGIVCSTYDILLDKELR